MVHLLPPFPIPNRTPAPRNTATVVWHPTAADPPADDLVVLTAAEDGEVWPGFKLGDQWYDIDATPQPAPRFWANFPEPPKQ